VTAGGGKKLALAIRFFRWYIFYKYDQAAASGSVAGPKYRQRMQ
jgi:hypothetical protein